VTVVVCANGAIYLLFPPQLLSLCDYAAAARAYTLYFLTRKRAAFEKKLSGAHFAELGVIEITVLSCLYSEVSVSGVSSHHPVSVEIICDFSYRVFHHAYPAVSFFVEFWDNEIFQFVVKIC